MKLSIQDMYALLFIGGVIAAALITLWWAHTADTRSRRNRHA